VQALGEFRLAADAAGLDGEDLARAGLGRVVHRGLDPGESVQDPDRHALQAADAIADAWIRRPRPAYHSKAATAEPTRRWLSLTSS
jgi:hypothetical protein